MYSPCDLFEHLVCRLPRDVKCMAMKFLVYPGKDVEFFTSGRAVDVYGNNVLIGRPDFRDDPADYGCLTGTGMTME